jgi:hypothetical protein
VSAADTDGARLEPARRRAAAAKRALAAATVVGFAVTLGLARAGQPGHSSPAGSAGGSNTSAVTSSDESDDGFGLGYDDGSLAPSSSGGAQFGTHVS